jgi:hypothetical protein
MKSLIKGCEGVKDSRNGSENSALHFKPLLSLQT